MRESIYTHFKNIYGECRDAVICFDDKLYTVFVTNSAHKMLGTNKSELHLSCLFAQSELNKIKDAVSLKRYFTFEYVNEINKLPVKAAVTPVFLEKIYYFVITLTPTYKSELDREQKYGIEVCVDAAASAIVKSTTDIANACNKIKDDQKLSKQILDNVFSIRKQFYNVEAIATNKLKEPSKYIVELGSYLERITKVITKHIGAGKIKFLLNLSNDVLVSQVSYQALDLIVCNIVSAFLNLNFGKADVEINASNSNGFNIIMFSAEVSTTRKLSNSYTVEGKSETFCDSTDMAIEVVKKLTGDCGGNVKFIQHSPGNVAFIIALPVSQVRERVLFAPDHCYDLNEQFNIIKVMLSDIDDFLI